MRPTRPASAQWLGGLNVPADWRPTQVKHLVRFSSGETITAERIEPQGLHAVYGANGLRGYTDRAIHSGTRVLVGRVGALCGNVHLVEGEYWASEHALVGHAQTELDLRWLRYLLQVMNLGQYSQATAQPVIAASRIESLGADVPLVEEQRAIADYLDLETARIDTLIEEQQRLIEMLRARRQDLIQAMVLGSANPFSPPLEAPFTAIGHHFSVTLGKMLDAGKAVRTTDLMLPYIRAGNIQDPGLKLDDVNHMPYSDAEAANLNLLKGDLLVVEGGAVGTNVLLHEDMPGWSFQKTVNRLRPLGNWSSAWLGYVLRTYRDIGVIDLVCNRSTISHLTAEKLRAMHVPSVEPQEQMRVAAILDRQTADIDTLIAETERFIELSKERRSALITAAVTGQIDVREMV